MSRFSVFAAVTLWALTAGCSSDSTSADSDSSPDTTTIEDSTGSDSTGSDSMGSDSMASDSTGSEDGVGNSDSVSTGDTTNDPIDLPDPPTDFDFSQIETGRAETDVRYLVDAGTSAEAVETNSDERPGFGEGYVTPFNTILTPASQTPNSNHAYSQLQAFSYDNTFVLLTEDHPEDPSATTVVRAVRGYQVVRSNPVGLWGNPRWHPTNYSTLVHFDSNEDETLVLQFTDVTSGDTTDVFTFPEAYWRYLGNQSNDELSRNGVWLAGQAVGEGDWSRIFALNIEDGRLGAELDPAALYSGVCTPDPEFGPIDPDWIGVSPLGRYLLVQWATEGTGRCEGLETYNIESGDYVGHVTSGHPHADTTLLADGETEVFVTADLTGPAPGGSYVGGADAEDGDQGSPALTYRVLPGPAEGEAEPNYLYLIDWGGFEHISCRGPFGYCLLGGYPSPENGARDPLEDEVYVIRLDGSGVIRLAHHHSSGADYWSQPRASWSADGRYVIFDSDWGLDEQTIAYVIDLALVPE